MHRSKRQNSSNLTSRVGTSAECDCPLYSLRWFFSTQRMKSPNECGRVLKNPLSPFVRQRRCNTTHHGFLRGDFFVRSPGFSPYGIRSIADSVKATTEWRSASWVGVGNVLRAGCPQNRLLRAGEK